MTSATTDFSPIRFSTDDIPMRDRAAVWREVHGRTVRIDVEPLSNDLSLNLSLRVFPDLKVVTTRTSGVRLTRTHALIADGDDDFRLVVNCSGSETVFSRGREVMLDAGDAVILSCADFGVVTRLSRGHSLGLHVPFAALAPLVANVEDAVMRPMQRDAQALRLLKGYVGVLQEEDTVATPELRRLVSAHIHDLVALAVGATQDAAYVANGRGVRAARLRAIKADIIENLSRNDLTIDALSRRHRLQPRYIQRLFESDGTTFSEFLLGQRLARAQRMLADPRKLDQNIGAIAFECGFGDLSYFNRRFRRLYGSAPSHFRAT